MESKMYGSRIPRAPKRALKTLSENEVKTKDNKKKEEDVMQSKLKKPKLADKASLPAPAPASQPKAAVDSNEWLEMSEKNDLSIDSLLAMKMTGKGKWDHKGRCEQMMPYIKQLRACTKYLRSCVSQADGIKQGLVDAHEKSLTEREKELEKLTAQLSELDKKFADSENSLSTIKVEMSGMKKDLESKSEAEMQHKVEISTLSNQLDHEKRVVGEKSEEISKMQENYFKSQEYAQNLQEFVKKLKEDTQKMNDSLLKIQEEKADLVNEMNLSKGSVVQLEEKLQSSKDLVDELQRQKQELNSALEAMQEQHAKSVEEMTRDFKKKEVEAKENIDALKSEKNQKKEELRAIEEKHKDVCETLEKCECDLKDKMKSLDEFESKCTGLENTIKEKEASHERELRAQVDQAQAEKECFEQEKATLESSIQQKSEELSEASSLLADSQGKLQELTEVNQKVGDELQASNTELNNKISECKSITSELENAKDELERYHQITGQSAENMERLMEKSEDLKHQNSNQSEVLEAMKSQYELLKQKLSLSEDQCNTLKVQNQNANEELEMKKALLKEADQQIHESEMLRKVLHNQILELKGNIRVFCRTRPLSEEEISIQANQNVPTISYTTKGEKTGKGLQLHMCSDNKKSKKRSSNGESHYNFDFDRSFQEQASQEEVFEEISQLVQSALDGYKVCIFAYGQTGSGKTHTMIGNPSSPGMIPRSLEQIFQSAEKMKEQGWTYTISVRMMEIYNEEYKDLLGKKLPAGKQHTVKHDQQGKTSVSYMTEAKVTSMEKVNTLLNKAMSVRSVGATQCNEHSSRSHFVFSLNIEGTNNTLAQTVSGVLNLVDLAGSERLSKSQATGDRLKETQNINKSLSALGDVIVSINNGDSHVPFRNSKLTWLLQPCLGNQSKALMFVNVSPNQESAQETLCSLRFASKVNACEIGTAKRHVS
jgi:kinesin family protein C1